MTTLGIGKDKHQGEHDQPSLRTSSNRGWIRLLPRFILFSLAILIFAMVIGAIFLIFPELRSHEAGVNRISLILNILQCAAILAAFSWFVSTNQFQPRAAFDLACNFFRVSNDRLVAELEFILDNKGLIDIYISDLICSVHTLNDRSNWSTLTPNNQLEFPRRLIPNEGAESKLASVIPKSFGYAHVRSGVRQTITYIVSLPSDTEIIRVTSSFKYSPFPGDYHTARRVFLIPPRCQLLPGQSQI